MTSTTGPNQGLGPEQLLFLQEALAAASALAAADRLGVLARLDAAPAGPVAIARDCGIGERGARVLLATLASLGLVEVAEDGSYRASAPGLGRLSPLIRPWGRLGEAIRDSRPAVAGDTPTGAELLYPAVTPLLGAWFAPSAEQAAAVILSLSKDLAPPGLRVLDLGAGAAPWSLALAARSPESRITAVDLPAVLAATRRAVATVGCDAQFEYLGGDLFSVDLGRSAYDLAIAGNLCHLFDEATNRRLLERVFDALRPGGTLALLEALPTERFDGPRPVILYALGLLRTGRGQVYPFSTFVSWLRERAMRRSSGSICLWRHRSAW
jgi:SAM-dependent methyltransferase